MRALCDQIPSHCLTLWGVGASNPIDTKEVDGSYFQPEEAASTEGADEGNMGHQMGGQGYRHPPSGGTPLGHLDGAVIALGQEDSACCA
mmetsp:Transcript_32543/g.83208  ORF Transcript_32543/g.83208 Transcript_32543/m.83208 type:complete len:89 (-) Transcript_32543:124-390(-)